MKFISEIISGAWKEFQRVIEAKTMKPIFNRVNKKYRDPV